MTRLLQQTVGLALMLALIVTGAGQILAQDKDGAVGWELERVIGRGNITDIAISPQGTSLAAAGSRGVWLYSLPELEDVAYLSPDPQDGGITSVSWAPDGTRLATGSWNAVINLWELRDGQARLMQNIPAHFSPAREVAWSPVADRLAIVYGNTIVIFRPDDNTPLMRLKANPGERLTSLTWSRDGRRVIASSTSGVLYLWDSFTGESLRGVPTVGVADSLDALSPDSTLVAYGIHIWQRADGRLLLTSGKYRGMRQNPVTVVAWSPNSTRLAFATADRSVRFRNLVTGQEVTLLEDNHFRVTDLKWTPDGQQLVSVSSNGRLEVWQPESGTRLAQRSGDYISWLRDVAWAPDGTRLATGGDWGEILIWDSRSGERIISQERHEDVVRQVVWSPDSARVASVSGSGGYEGDLRVWDAANGELLATLQSNPATGYVLERAAWSPDGLLLVADHETFGSGRSRNVLAWESESWSRVSSPAEAETWLTRLPWSTRGTRTGGENVTYSLALSPDAALRALGKWDGTVILQDVSDGKTLHVFRDGENQRGFSVIDSVVWSPNGRHLAAGGTAGTVWIWEVETRTLLARLEGHTWPVFSLAWSPDGTRLASVGEDGVVMIWRTTG